MITAVVGGQYGSEAKGAVVGVLASGYKVHVRVGAANAGHTVYVRGTRHTMQQLPCAAYANPEAKLVLGAGAMISPEILFREIQLNQRWRKAHQLPPLQLFVDHRAHVVCRQHVLREQATGLAERIGSTSTVAKEGIGAAQAARVMRTDYLMAGDYRELLMNDDMEVVDTVQLLREAHVFHTSILLEGTQGAGLSNTTGQYPYVTSRNTSAAGLAADCGIGPMHLDHVIMVCRTTPIRVAGNSGPFYPGSEETTWRALGVDEQTERTTVTKKIRRVAYFNVAQIVHGAWINSATEIALMHADYLCPEIAGESGVQESSDIARYDRIGPLVALIEQETQLPVTLIGTSPQTVIMRDSARRPFGTTGIERLLQAR